MVLPAAAHLRCRSCSGKIIVIFISFKNLVKREKYWCVSALSIRVGIEIEFTRISACDKLRESCKLKGKAKFEFYFQIANMYFSVTDGFEQTSSLEQQHLGLADGSARSVVCLLQQWVRRGVLRENPQGQ